MVTCSQWGGGWDPRSSRRPIRLQLKLSRPMAAKFQLLAEPRGKSSPLYPVTYVQDRHRGSTCDPTHAQCSLGNKTIWKRRQDPQKRGDQTQAHTQGGRWKKKEDTVLRLPRDKVFYLFSSMTMRKAWRKKKKNVARKYRRPLMQSKGRWAEESLELSYFPFRFVELRSLFDAMSFVSALLCLRWEYSEQPVSLASSVNSRKSLQKLMSGRFLFFFFGVLFRGFNNDRRNVGRAEKLLSQMKGTIRGSGYKCQIHFRMEVMEAIQNGETKRGRAGVRLGGSISQSIVPLLLEFPLFCCLVAQVHVKSNKPIFSFIFKNALDFFQVINVYNGPSAELHDKDRLKWSNLIGFYSFLQHIFNTVLKIWFSLAPVVQTSVWSQLSYQFLLISHLIYLFYWTVMLLRVWHF